MKTVFLLFLLALLPGCDVGTSDSGLDATFGTSGITTIDFGSTEDKAHGVAIASTGDIFVVGSAKGTNKDFAIAKLGSDGKLDTEFSTDGMQTIDFGSDDIAYAVAVQSDGKIVIAGNSDTGASGKLAVARLTTTGELDTSFDTDGKFTYLVGSGSANFRALNLDSSSRPLITGSATVSGRTRFVVARLTTTGALDTTFAGSGIATETPGSTSDTATSLVITSTRLLVGGTRTTVPGSDFAILALTTSGTLDSTFGVSGVATFDFGSFPGSHSSSLDTGVSLTQDSSSRLVLAGTVAGTKQEFGVARFLSTGAVDTSFGTSGGMLKVVQTGTTTVTDLDTSIFTAIASGSYIYLAGYSGTATASYVALLSVGSDGAMNSFFGSGGAELIDDAGTRTEAEGAAIQSDGKLVTGGSVYGDSGWDFLALRYTP